MASVLPLFKQSLLRASEFMNHGRGQNAARVYEKLSRFADLPADAVIEVHAGLGRIAYQNGEYRRAVRHFSVALSHSPRNASILYLRARSLAALGMKQFRRSSCDLRLCLEYNPSSARAHSLLGWLLCKAGMEAEGLKHHFQAVKLRSHQPAYLNRLVKFLTHAHRWEEGRAALTRAMFLNKGDKKFQAIWDQFQFLQARSNQLKQRQTPEEKLVVLPFLKIAGKQVRKAGARMDGPECLPTPHATKAQIGRTKRRVK